jgi:predicted dehydrogenase
VEFLKIQAPVYESAEDMLGRKDVDAVVVTTPDYLHESACITAFKHGKHVFVDKPLATSAGGCLKIMEAAHKAKKLLYMGFNLRHVPVLHKMKELVDAGALGEIFSMQAIEYYNGGRTYMSRWNRLKKFTGGLFIHKGSHDFDIINWIMGKARPVQAGCFANVFTLNPRHLPFKTKPGLKPGPTCFACPYVKECPDVWPDYRPDTGDTLHHKMYGGKASAVDGYRVDLCMYLSEKDTHDQGIANVLYDNGATAAHSEYFVTPKHNRIYFIEGTKGHAEISLSDGRIELLPRWTSDRIEYKISDPIGGHGGADSIMCAEFIRCLKKGLRPTASGIDGAWSVAIGESCELSRTKNRMVKISEVLDIKHPLLKK